MKTDLYFVMQDFTGKASHLILINDADYDKLVEKYKRIECSLERAPSYLQYDNDTYLPIIEE